MEDQLNKTSSQKFRIAAWVVFFLAGILVCGLVFSVFFLRQTRRSGGHAPIVIVSDPEEGDTPFVGSNVAVVISAFGDFPIARVELWMDGTLVEAKESPYPEGLNPYHAQFILPISEGIHTLSALAVDSNLVIGKSTPVGIMGIYPSESDQIYSAVVANPGETLADIADANHTDVDTLQKANPGLDGQTLPQNTIINLPIPKDSTSPPQLPPAASNPPLQIPNFPMLSAANFWELNVSPLLAQVSLLSGSVPSAGPSKLEGLLDGCEVTLRWEDFSTNEIRYEVWTAWMGLEPRLVASLGPSPKSGPAWYKFFAPQEGRVPFWVEAVTPFGSQASNDVFIDIPQGCAKTTPGDQYLIVQIFDLTTTAAYDKVYCYVSFENNPYIRVPSEDNAFVPVRNGKASFGGGWVGTNVPSPNEKLIPVPQDSSLDILGKCLAWSGGNLFTLGLFNGNFRSQDWDGSRKILKGDSFSIEFAVKPYTPAVGLAMGGNFWYEDPSLKAPYDLRISKVFTFLPQSKVDPRERTLLWKWDGDPKSITGFYIYLDGKPYKFVPGSSARSDSILEPTYCGHTIRWSVTAVNSPSQSPRSKPLQYDQVQCQQYAMVWFKNIKFISTSEDASLGNCDNLEIYYRLWVESPFGSVLASKDFGMAPPVTGGCIQCTATIKCGNYTFQRLGSVYFGEQYPDKLVFPISFDPSGKLAISPGWEIWDYDNALTNDRVAYGIPGISFSSFKEAQDVLGCGKEYTTDPKSAFAIYSAATSSVTYELSVYPNACLDFPIGVPLPVPPWASKN